MKINPDQLKTLNCETVISFHDDVLIESHEGPPGIRQAMSLEAALNRIDSHIFYEGIDNLFEIAAIYGIALAQGHIFNNGNKRTALISMITFLKLNNFDVNDSNNEAADMMVSVAEKKVSCKELAEWLEKNSLPINF